MLLLNGNIEEGGFEYRGISVHLFLDHYANQVFFYYNNGRVYLGKDNGNFESFIKAFIDDQLDTVFRFDNFPGAKLEYFQNGQFRDIRLIYRKRLLKVFLIADINKLNKDKLIKDSQAILVKVQEEFG